MGISSDPISGHMNCGDIPCYKDRPEKIRPNKKHGIGSSNLNLGSCCMAIDESWPMGKHLEMGKFFMGIWWDNMESVPPIWLPEIPIDSYIILKWNSYLMDYYPIMDYSHW